jgi:hypothetical protein
LEGGIPEMQSLSLSDTASNLLSQHEFPPKIETVLPKAVFYDLANDYIEYPDLEQKFPQKKGFFSKWFGR